MQDLVAGQIDLVFGNPDQLPLVQTGGIKAYAVTSDARLGLAPEVPTFTELGLPALSFSVWFGLFAPKGINQTINSLRFFAGVVLFAKRACGIVASGLIGAKSFNTL
jgi:tripartite-type tricarboxylate transporter receptor subunit TctC